jgi:RNA polymerase sigma-70 factor (ECF subfamily)
MQVDVAELETHRAALTGHCYRMLGSAADAEDAVQETIVRAWRSLDRFEGRASLRTWLHRIATNVCLDTLSDSERRVRPFEEGPAGSLDHELQARERSHWLEPIPDARVLPSDADPYHLAVLRQSIRLAFVAALQHLPPRQRAAVILTEVLGWSAAEVADCLETSVPAVNSALQRARATLGGLGVVESDDALSDEQSDLLERYVDAFQRYDVDALVGLLRDDATLSMPPYTLWLQGPHTIRQWLLGPGSGCRGSRLVPVNVSGTRGFAQYRPSDDGIHRAWALIILELGADGIAGWNSFLDTATLFPMLDLPLEKNFAVDR